MADQLNVWVLILLPAAAIAVVVCLAIFGPKTPMKPPPDMTEWAREHFPEDSRATAVKVGRIIVDQLGVQEEEVKPSTRFIEDLKANDLSDVELVMAIEEEFKFKMSDEDAEKIITVSDLVEYVHRQTNGRC